MGDRKAGIKEGDVGKQAQTGRLLEGLKEPGKDVGMHARP